MSTFDIASLLNGENSEEPTFKVAVEFDEDGEEKSGFIIVGKNSSAYQEVARDIRADNIMKASRRKGVDGSTEEGSKIIVNNVINNEHRIAKAIVVGWFGYTNNGKEISFDIDIVERMFVAKPQWQARVLAALEVDANFTTN